MQDSQQDKKLVEKYKQTNRSLRQQLMTLNDQIDKLLIKKSNTVGLKPLPIISKKLDNAKVIQHQIYNMKKRLQLLERDKLKYQARTGGDFNVRLRALEEQLQNRNQQKQELKRLVKSEERQERKNLMKNKIEVKEDVVYLEKIEKLNEEITRNLKIQKQLKKVVSEQQAFDHRKKNFIAERQYEHKQLQKSPPKLRSKNSEQPQPITHSNITDLEWKQLKRQFLQLKESKQQQEMYLYQENDHLRRQIRTIEAKLKQKRGRLEYIKNSAIKRAKNYSTLDQHDQPKYRYRDKSNSIHLARRSIDI